MTNAEVLANEILCLEGAVTGVRRELAALADFLDLANEWIDGDSLDLAVSMSRRAVEKIEAEAGELVSSVETIKGYALLPGDEPAAEPALAAFAMVGEGAPAGAKERP